jgi:NAD(P)H-dependent FMN reductase
MPPKIATPAKILVFSGSIRTGSRNARLAALAAKELTLAEADVTLISLVDYPLPIYDGDREATAGLPENAVKLKRMFCAHQGVFIASPELNASIAPLLKNTIDWVSRVREPKEAPYAAFRHRVFALGAAANGRDGGLGSLAALRHVLEIGCGALVIPEQVAVAHAERAFDEMDNIKDEHTAAALKSTLQRLVETAQVLA